jgi:DNA-binding transcriptional regulator YhcF (GntR family)
VNLTKKQQVIFSIEEAVQKKRLKKGDKLPSLTELKSTFSISRDTAIEAYNELKSRGIIESVVGKGYYLSTESVAVKKKIFVLFDELNAFKETLYKSLVANLEDSAEVDIFFHHFNRATAKTIIENNKGNYSHYVIMPANLKKVEALLESLPQHKIYILDQMQETLSHYPAIYQNFEKGVFEGLLELKQAISKYKHLVLIFDSVIQPSGIRTGFQSFCNAYGIDNSVVASNEKVNVQQGMAYLVLDDNTLINIMKQVKQESFRLGVDVGLIAYNDTPLKEIIADGITAISTDFSVMGKALAQMITQGSKDTSENSINVTLRNSL